MIMKKGMKLFLAGAAIAAAAGVVALKKYQDSYEEIIEDKFDDEENDFVPMETYEDDFDYYVEDMEQIIFDE